jgi:glycosyltransferase involved in cell wall biosynthesis
MTLNAPHPENRRVLVAMRYPGGGIRAHVLDTYPLLARLGFSFCFVGPAGPEFRDFAHDFADWEGVDFVEADLPPRLSRLVRRIEILLSKVSSRRPDLATTLAMAATVRRLLREQRFGLIHSHSWISGISCVLANAGCGIPHVFTPHGTFNGDEFTSWLGRLMRRVVAKILSRTDLCVAVSEGAGANNIRFFPGLDRGRSRMVVIPNGVHLQRLDKCGEENADGLRARLGIPSECMLLGYLGRLSPEKGFLVLIDALNRLMQEVWNRPFHLLAIATGDHEQAYRAEIARRDRLADKITFIDAVPNAAPVLRQLDLLVVPSLREAFGLLAAEALCLGVPVVGSDCQGLREVLEGSPAHMVPAGDAAALTAVLRQAMTSPRKIEAEQFIPEARHRFDVRAGAQRLASYFLELCDGKPINEPCVSSGHHLQPNPEQIRPEQRFALASQDR